LLSDGPRLLPLALHTTAVEILERFQAKALRVIADAPWYIPNAMLHREPRVSTVKHTVKNFRITYRGRTAQHPNRLTPPLSGFGGLGVACWPLVPKFAGSNPADAVGFFRAKESTACLPSEDLRHEKKNPAIYVEVGIAGKIDRPFLAVLPSFTNRGLSCRLTWSASGDDGRN
jgi:hypothetical protein